MLVHRQQDKLDKPDLCRGFGDLLPVHEWSNGQTLGLLTIALHEVLLQEAVDPGL